MPPGKLVYKQQIENTRQLEAFIAYREMGIVRSLKALEVDLRARWGLHAPCLTTLERWSSRFAWQDRLQQWVTAEAGKTSEVVREATVRIQLDQLQAMQHGLVIAMEVIRRSKSNMPVSTAVQLLSVVSRMRADLLGAAATKIEVSGPDGGPIEIKASVVAVDLSQFTVEQLGRFETLMQEIDTNRAALQETKQLA